MDRPIRVAHDGLGISAVVEVARRTVAVGVVELADQPPVGTDLVPEIVLEQPGRPVIPDPVELLRLVIAIFDPAGQLHAVEPVTHPYAAGPALDLGAGLPVLERADIRTRAEIPVFESRQVDAGRVR